MDKPVGKKHMDIATRPNLNTRRSGSRLSPRQWAVVGLVVVALVASWFGMQAYLHRNEQKIDHNRYQAVFLEDGKIFFGKLENLDGPYITLNNAYQARSTEADKDNTTNSSYVRLARLADDTAYSPDGSISIQSSKILYWQNLKTDSKVSQLIDKK
jgi:hypothetical protein